MYNPAKWVVQNEGVWDECCRIVQRELDRFAYLYANLLRTISIAVHHNGHVLNALVISLGYAHRTRADAGANHSGGQQESSSVRPHTACIT